MVICTFHQPGANEPVDAQRLTSSSAPFVIPTHGVRWHAGVPYGYPHLSSTRGKRARWHAETNIVFCTIWPSRDSELGGRQRYFMVIHTFHQPRGMNLTVCRWYWSFDSGYFQNFCRFYSPRPETFKPDDARGSSLLGGDDQVRWRREVSWLSRFIAFKDTEVLLTLLMPFPSFLNDRFRWSGYWLAE